MTRAEEAALEAYPRDDDRDLNFRRKNYRIAFERGYEQAEKDLALKWEDIEEIYKLVLEVEGSGEYACFPYGKPIYEEVLRRFNNLKQQ